MPPSCAGDVTQDFGSAVVFKPYFLPERALGHFYMSPFCVFIVCLVVQTVPRRCPLEVAGGLVLLLALEIWRSFLRQLPVISAWLSSAPFP